jgi:hypothetical protein
VAAPLPNKVLLPDDSANAGKKVRTQTRVVGADTVHEHFFVNVHPHLITGIYMCHSGTLTVPTAAHNGTTTGHLWFINPSGATIRGALRGIAAQAANIAAAADLLYTRQLLSLITFTGTASGATLTPAKRDSTDAAAQMSVRTASTGLTVTLGATVRHWVPPIQVGTTGVGVFPTIVYPERDFTIDECPVFRTGEGAVLWSADASTTTNKRFSCDLSWEERDAT